jgi:hypothetical protein
MLGVGATKGRDLWLEVRRIQSGASRYRHGDVAWLDLKAPYRHLVVDVTVTSTRMNTSVPREWEASASHSQAVLHWELNKQL